MSGQILEPSKWTVSASKTAAKAGEEMEIIFKAVIEKNWYLYSNEFDCEDGPTKTSFTFIPNSTFELVGPAVAINPIAKHDDIFECDIKIFKGTGEFRPAGNCGVASP